MLKGSGWNSEGKAEEKKMEKETLMDGLMSEIERCSKLKALYDEIPSGAFGALVIQQNIDRAKTSIASGDLAEMIQSYEALKGCK